MTVNFPTAPLTPIRGNNNPPPHYDDGILATLTPLRSPSSINGSTSPSSNSGNSSNKRRVKNMPVPPAPLSWWEKSAIKRSSYAIDTMLDQVLQKTPFLQQQAQHEQGEGESSSSIVASFACLDRDEIQTGQLLGYGSFSNVYEVTAINLLLEEDEEDDQEVHVQRKQRRKYLAQTASDNCYALKQLKPELIQDISNPSSNNNKNNNNNTFQGAACDLLVEAHYLATLNHPNILKLRGMALGNGAQAYCQSGSYDGFFLLTDRLVETLQQRIQFWKQQYQMQQLQDSLLPPPPPPIIGLDKNFSQKNHHHMNNDPNLKLWIEKIDIGLQIARALEYLHQHRLIYRDLKPTNIGFKTDRKTVQLYDFGFCRQLPSSSSNEEVDRTTTTTATMTTTTAIPTSNKNNNNNNLFHNTWSLLFGDHNVDKDDRQDTEDVSELDDIDVTNDNTLYPMSGKGSLMYIANEVIAPATGRSVGHAGCVGGHGGSYGYNQKADVYSWSMVMYEMCCLVKPFPNIRTAEQHRQLVCYQGERPIFFNKSKVPTYIQYIVQQCWKAQVDQRWSSHHVVQQLEALLTNIEQRGSVALEETKMMTTLTVPSSGRESSSCCTHDAIMDCVTEIADNIQRTYNKILKQKKEKQNDHKLMGQVLPPPQLVIRDDLKKQVARHPQHDEEKKDEKVEDVAKEEHPEDEAEVELTPRPASSVSPPDIMKLKETATESTSVTEEESVELSFSIVLNQVESKDVSSGSNHTNLKKTGLDSYDNKEQDKDHPQKVENMEEVRCPPSPLKPQDEFVLAWERFASQMDTTSIPTIHEHKQLEHVDHQTEEPAAWLMPRISNNDEGHY